MPRHATDIQPDQQPWGGWVDVSLLGVMGRFSLPPIPVCAWAASTYPKRSPSLLHKSLPAIPVYMRRLCGGLSWRQASLLPAYLGLALCLLWLVLSSPQACTAALKRHFDGVLLPILPSLNRSCCHLYFDLCIPWSIYACERGEGRRGGRSGGAGGVERGRQRQLQCLLLYPGERLRYICLLKASATDRHSTAAERYKASSVDLEPPTTSQPPSWVNRHCMHVRYAQTKTVFFQLRPGSLKRVKRCCSPLRELQKPKARKKTRRVLLLLQSPPQTRAIRPEKGFCTQFARLSSAFVCVWNRQRQASGRFWENRYRGTNQPPQEGRRASKTPLSQREDLSLRCRPRGVPPLYNCYQTDQMRSNQALWMCLRLLAL